MRGLLIVTVALALAAPAWSRPDPQVVALKKQVAILQAQVKQLRADLKEETNARICWYALVQDSFRVVYPALSKLTQYITGSTVPAWENLPRFDDQGACAYVGVPRP